MPPPPPPARTPTSTRGDYRPLTYSLLKDIEKQAAREGKTIDDIQFYLSNDIKLVYKENGTSIKIDPGKADDQGTIYRSKRQLEEMIILPKYLPGLYVQADNRKVQRKGDIVLGISFDSNDSKNTNVLYFILSPSNSKDYFFLQTGQNPNSEIESRYRIDYGGKNYFASFSHDEDIEIPYLMVQLVFENKVSDTNVITLDGRRLKKRIEIEDNNSEVSSLYEDY
ncbi:hypothetical protein FACS1894102_0250 [Spirochaetia bacterium]|nr:hypothetical protein FACS1894102_0250 [Spirochaetia bacterium]